MSTSNLPHDKRLDGPPEGKEVVRTFTVMVSGTQFDPDDEDEDDEEGLIRRALQRCGIEADVEHTGTEYA